MPDLRPRQLLQTAAQATMRCLSPLPTIGQEPELATGEQWKHCVKS